MPKYLLTFVSRDRNDRLEKTVEAPNMDAATRIGQSMNMYYKGYDNLWVEEYPYDSEGVFGIVFDVTVDESRCRSRFLMMPGEERLFIKARNVNEAKQYYRDNLQGKWCNPHKELDPNGYWKFGRILESYAAAFSGFDFDATK